MSVESKNKINNLPNELKNLILDYSDYFIIMHRTMMKPLLQEVKKRSTERIRFHNTKKLLINYINYEYHTIYYYQCHICKKNKVGLMHGMEFDDIEDSGCSLKCAYQSFGFINN